MVCTRNSPCPPETQPWPFTTGVLSSEPSSATSIRIPPPISMTVTVTVPPGRRELLCSTALVTVSEASNTAASVVAGLASPRDFSTKERAEQTCSGRPGTVMLPRTVALAIMARSRVASLARAANGAICVRSPPRREAGCRGFSSLAVIDYCIANRAEPVPGRARRGVGVLELIMVWECMPRKCVVQI
jgi:hypothetical protein